MAPSAIRAAIRDDKRVIPYRPAMKLIAGSTNAALFLHQLIYWWENNDQKAFYKFNEPCDHSAYRAGDSWCEELLLTPDEFTAARDKVATKLTAKTKDAFLNPAIGANLHITDLVYYWNSADRRTFYMLNEDFCDGVLHWAYVLKHHELYPIYRSKDFDLVGTNLEKSILLTWKSLTTVIGKSRITYTETTTKNTTENDLSDFANAQSDMRHANANDDTLPLSDNERDSAVLPLDDHMATPPRPAPVKSGKSKAAKPKAERPQNPLYNAMRDDYFMGGEGFNLNKSLKELKVFDDLKPEYIKPFAAWYDAKNPGMTRPGWSKIADHYGKWLKAGKPGLTTSTAPAIGVPKWMQTSQEQYND